MSKVKVEYGIYPELTITLDDATFGAILTALSFTAHTAAGELGKESRDTLRAINDAAATAQPNPIEAEYRHVVHASVVNSGVRANLLAAQDSAEADGRIPGTAHYYQAVMTYFDEMEARGQ